MVTVKPPVLLLEGPDIDTFLQGKGWTHFVLEQPLPVPQAGGVANPLHPPLWPIILGSWCFVHPESHSSKHR